jgi:hypothetical protein
VVAVPRRVLEIQIRRQIWAKKNFFFTHFVLLFGEKFVRQKKTEKKTLKATIKRRELSG